MRSWRTFEWGGWETCGPAEKADTTEDRSDFLSVGEPLMGFKPRKGKKWRVSRRASSGILAKKSELGNVRKRPPSFP